MGWLYHSPDIVGKPIQKRAHTQLVGEHSATVISARWATKKKHRQWMNGRTFSKNPRKQGKSHHQTEVLPLSWRSWGLGPPFFHFIGLLGPLLWNPRSNTETIFGVNRSSVDTINLLSCARLYSMISSSTSWALQNTAFSVTMSVTLFQGCSSVKNIFLNQFCLVMFSK